MGQIAGWFEEVGTGAQRGFLRSPAGQITVFDPPNSLGLEARGLNDAGHVTGPFLDSVTSAVRGFLRSPAGQFTVFDPPNSGCVLAPPDCLLAGEGTFPRAINNSVQITGWFDDTVTGTARGFLRGRSFGIFIAGLPQPGRVPLLIPPE